MDGGASPNHYKHQLYFNTRRLYRCHAFGNNCKTQWKSMVLNLACVLVTCPIVVVFVLQYVKHITNVFLTCCFVPFWHPNHFGSACLFVVCAPGGAWSRNNNARNVWRAVARHIFLSMSWLLHNYMFYLRSGRAVPDDTVSNVVWCTPNSGDVGISRCGLLTVAHSDAKFARCS